MKWGSDVTEIVYIQSILRSVLGDLNCKSGRRAACKRFATKPGTGKFITVASGDIRFGIFFGTRLPDQYRYDKKEESPNPTHSSGYYLVTGHWSLVIGHWSLVTGHWSLVIGHWLLVAGYWSLVTGRWLLVAGY
jgi:hypothetical protein